MEGNELRRQHSRRNTNGQLTYGPTGAALPALKEARPGKKAPEGPFCPFSESRLSLVTAERVEMMEDPL